MNIITPAREFKETLKQVAKGCSTDDSRPVLQAVRLTVTKSGDLRLESADGFRAHRADLPGTYVPAPEILLSPDQVRFVLKFKILKRDNFTLEIDTDAGTLAIDGKTAPGNFIDGRYPDINQVWPKDTPISLEVESAELLNAVKRARVFAHVCRLYINNGLIVRGTFKETGESWTPVNVGTHSFPYALAIAFNCDFLIDFLKLAPGRVKIQASKPSAPAIFSSSDSDFSAVIMPMYIDNPETVPTILDIPRPIDRPGLDAEEYYKQFTPAPVAHDPNYGTDAGHIDSDVFESRPEPGAVIQEIKTVWSYELDPEPYRTGKLPKVIVFHLGNDTPDPDAPIPVQWPEPRRQPVFIDTGKNGALTIGTCSGCIDPDPHALIDGLCSPCRTERRELAASHV